jgi:hypothetical protein
VGREAAQSPRERPWTRTLRAADRAVSPGLMIGLMFGAAVLLAGILALTVLTA